MRRSILERLESCGLTKEAELEPSDTALEALQARLGYTFREPALLRVALHHASAVPAVGNQFLSWLGDAALYELYAEELAAALGWTDSSMGPLTFLRQGLISRAACEKRALALGLDALCVMGPSVRGTGPPTPNMLAELYEAVVGAVHADGGLEAVRGVQARLFPLPPREELARLALEVSP